VRRPTRQELDEAIVDCAALLFARHGYTHTSVQQIADAVGYSKTGLLHRFPTKEALREAVAQHFVAELDAVVAAVDVVPAGPDRDLAVVRALVDLALRRRGTIALAVSALGAYERPEDLAWLNGVAEGLFRAFEGAGAGAARPGPLGAADGPDGGRQARVYGALGALAVVSLATPQGQAGRLRDVLVATAYGALGHGTPRPSGS
jgi:AcrR family transcriptional regulator